MSESEGEGELFLPPAPSARVSIMLRAINSEWRQALATKAKALLFPNQTCPHVCEMGWMEVRREGGEGHVSCQPCCHACCTVHEASPQVRRE